MISKLIKYSFLLFLTYIAIFMIIFHVKEIRVDKTNETIKEYKYKNEYQEKYPIDNYVTESLDAYPAFRKFILESMFSYETLVGQSNTISSGVYAIQNFFNKDYDYLKEVDDLQVIEESTILLQKNECLYTDEKNYVCTYTYKGKLLDQEAPIEGEVDIYANGTYNLVVSFKDENGIISKNNAKLLSDDSTSEMLTYLIVEETQNIVGTNMEPNDAAKYYYGNSIEQLAGSISYHAVIAYMLEEYEIENEDMLYEKVEEVNITLDDDDSFFVNRSY